MKFITTSLRNKLLFIVGIGTILMMIAVGYGFMAALNGMEDIDTITDTQINNERRVINMALNFKKQVQEKWTWLVFLR